MNGNKKTKRIEIIPNYKKCDIGSFRVNNEIAKAFDIISKEMQKKDKRISELEELVRNLQSENNKLKEQSDIFFNNYLNNNSNNISNNISNNNISNNSNNTYQNNCPKFNNINSNDAMNILNSPKCNIKTKTNTELNGRNYLNYPMQSDKILSLTNDQMTKNNSFNIRINDPFNRKSPEFSSEQEINRKKSNFANSNRSQEIKHKDSSNKNLNEIDNTNMKKGKVFSNYTYASVNKTNNDLKIHSKDEVKMYLNEVKRKVPPEIFKEFIQNIKLLIKNNSQGSEKSKILSNVRQMFGENYKDLFAKFERILNIKH